jgi:hypothetical protein
MMDIEDRLKGIEPLLMVGTLLLCPFYLIYVTVKDILKR